MKTKRGQITVFIIIGLLLLIGAGFYFVVNKQTINIPLLSKLSASPVKYHVETCLEEAGLPGVYLLASKGGYIYMYDKILLTENQQIAYHSEYGKEVGPSTEFMESELNRFIGESLVLCIDDFRIFEQYDFEYGKMEVKTTITNKEVLVKVDFPITVQQRTSKGTISDFSASFPVRLGYILNVKDRIISELSDKIDFDDLASYGVQVNLLPYDLDDTVYSIYDLESGVEYSEFVFNFAVKNRMEENMPPSVRDIGNQTAYIDEEFYLRVTASDPEGEELQFSDETALFDINSTSGEIRFTPTPFDEGMFYIPITVSDGFSEVSKTLTLNVTKR